MYSKLLTDASDLPGAISGQSKSLCSCNNSTSGTLVIHPDDPTTDFLSAIYRGKGWDVISDPFLWPEEVAGLISSHDRIICLGHGSPTGLFGCNGFIIDASLVSLLKRKRIVAIWCHADQFVEQHELRGFYSGMFISEFGEAWMCGIEDTDEQTIKSSNDLFAPVLGKHIDSDNILGNVKKEYVKDGDAVVEFNRNRLYSNI